MPTAKKTTSMDSQKKGALLSRLRTIEGHVRGILRMVEAGAYCPNVVAQALAVERAIDSFVFELLEHHLETCFVAAVRGESQQERERVLREILDIFQASARLKKGGHRQATGGKSGPRLDSWTPGADWPGPGAPEAGRRCCS